MVSFLALSVGICSCMIYSVKLETVYDYCRGAQDQNLWYAGIVIQSYWLLIVIRDIAITLAHFLSTKRYAIPAEKWYRLLRKHFFFACVDMGILTGLVSWGAAALARFSGHFYEAPTETGLPLFAGITTLNVIMESLLMLTLCSDHLLDCSYIDQLGSRSMN